MYCDCHIHMALDGSDWKAALARHKTAPDEAFIRATLKNYQALGFDFLRDGGDRWGAGEFAAKIAAEYGIRYRTPCFPIYKKGHYGSFIGRGYETLDEFRALVREVKGCGGHFIKIMISGLMDFNHYGVLRNGEAGVLFVGPELAHRAAAEARALEDNRAAIPVQLELAGHRCARPGLVFRLCGDRAGLGPLGGVDAVEHREQELRPGRFAALVREREDIEAGRERQLGILQAAEAGAHTENGHASSLPSMAARSIRAASAAVRRASSSGALS